MVPVFLTAWGGQLYGEWLTLSAAVAYLGLTDIGLQVYSINRLTQAFARGRTDEYVGVLHSSALLSVAICTGVGVLAILTLRYVPWSQWFDFVVMDQSLAMWVALLLGLQLLLAIPKGLLTGLYRSVGEYTRGVHVRNVVLLLQLGLTVSVLLGGGTARIVAAVQLLPLIAEGAFAAWDLPRRHPATRVGLVGAEWPMMRSLVAPSLLFLAIQIATLSTIQGVTLVLGAVLGAGTVAIFATHRALALLVRHVTGAINSAMWPEVTRLEAVDRLSTLRHLHRCSTKLVVAFSIWVATVLYFRAESLIQLWTGGELPYESALMTAFAILIIVQAPWLTSSVVLAASNRHRPLAIAYGISAAAGVALAYPLTRAAGVAGAAFALVVADGVLAAWWIPTMACRILKDPLRRYVREVLLRGVGAVVAILASGYLLDRWLVRGTDLIAVSVYATLLLAVATVATVVWWLKPGERSLLASALIPHRSRT